METGDDCHFYYNAACAKGDACMFRHVAEAKQSDTTCESWRLGRCFVPKCPLRHVELQKPACYFETQPGGCAKPHCPYLHKFPRTVVPAATTVGVPTTAPPVQSTPMAVSHPPPASLPNSTVGWMPPRHSRPPPPGMWGPGRPPAPGFFPGQGPPPGGHFRPFLPTSMPFPVSEPGPFPQGHPAGIMPIRPIVINPNEDSDLENSPMKSSQRTVAPLTVPPPKVDNPLDYFLNAKPFIDPNLPRPKSRSPSPTGRTSPYRKRGSASPVRRSPRRSLSPDLGPRRRSMSAERYSGGRRRSNSPDRRDTRRFGRRSRSPPRRRSRSPGRGRNQGILNRFRAGNSKGSRLEEVKVSGPKIVSLKKDKKEKDEEVEEVKEKVEEDKADKPKEKASESTDPLVKEEVKSLEEIYRERALLSMMEAKKKKKNKRKRWETVKGSNSRKSESEKSDKSEGSQQATMNEKGDNSTQEDSSSDSPDEEGGSDIDFNEDVDIELGEGEIEVGDEQNEDKAESDQNLEGKQDERKAVIRKNKSGRSETSKPSIKSRLGLRALEDVTGQASSNKARSVKDRLGLKSSGPDDRDKPLRSGIIKLNRDSKSDDIFSRIRLNRELRGNRAENSKNILMVPQITIKNRTEDRKTDIKQRLGLLDEDAEDSDSRKKKKDIDKELMKLLGEEEVDIDFEDLELLTKKEKKKLLKKLLVQQGREDEYELFKRKKKRTVKRKKDRMDERGDREKKRRINIKGRIEEAGEKEEQSWDEDLMSEEDIQLEEEDAESKENTPEAEIEPDVEEVESTETDAVDSAPAKSQEEIMQEKAEKEARLREALEPKSIDDIRRERAIKKAEGDGGVRFPTGNNRRKIVLADEEKPAEKPEPPVKVTFGGSENVSMTKPKLIRLGGKKDESASNIRITARPAKKERQIYIPPSVKRTDEPAPVKKPPNPTKGREIIDYSDMFLKKSTSAPDVTVKRITTRVVPPTESSLSVKLPKAAPKVEVKDATVKTFAEIMAEKKRKRLEAQNAGKKSYTPISFDDPESSNSPGTLSTPEDLPSSSTRNFKSIPTSHSANSSPVKSELKTLKLKKSASRENIQTETKPVRWKRRKLSEQSSSPTKNLVINSSDDSQSNVATSVADVCSSQTISGSDSLKREELTSIGFQESESQDSYQSTTSKRRTSEEQPSSNGSSSEKKPKLSDSLLDDFDDDLLDLEDESLELNPNQDHDELMREMDELLS